MRIKIRASGGKRKWYVFEVTEENLEANIFFVKYILFKYRLEKERRKI